MSTRWKAYHFIGKRTPSRTTYIRTAGILRLVVEERPGLGWRSMGQFKLTIGMEPHTLFSDIRATAADAKKHATQRAVAIIDRTRSQLGGKSRYKAKS